MNREITDEEFESRYGDLEMTLDYYYKYCFHYFAVKDGLQFRGCFGGDADQIYRVEIFALEYKKVRDIGLQSFEVYKENKLMEYWYINY
jgi:hypothetical protein